MSYRVSSEYCHLEYNTSGNNLQIMNDLTKSFEGVLLVAF